MSPTGSVSHGGATSAYHSATIGTSVIIIGTAKNEWMTSDASSSTSRAG